MSGWIKWREAPDRQKNLAGEGEVTEGRGRNESPRHHLLNPAVLVGAIDTCMEKQEKAVEEVSTASG